MTGPTQNTSDASKGTIVLSTKGMIVAFILFLVVGFGLYQMGKLLPNSKYQAKLEAYQADAKRVVEIYSDSMKKISLQLRDSSAQFEKESHQYTITITQLQQQATQLKLKNKELLNELQLAIDSAPPVCDPVVMACQKVVAGKDEEIRIKDSTLIVVAHRDTTQQNDIRVLKISEKLQMDRGDSLDRTILNFPKPPKLFSILKVTPTQAFLGGVLTTVLVHFIIVK